MRNRREAESKVRNGKEKQCRIESKWKAEVVMNAQGEKTIKFSRTGTCDRLIG